jgi:predicted transcriptional regulator
MLTKEKILAAINEMPEDQFENIDVLLERLVVLSKIDRGLSDVEKGNVISHDDMKNQIDSWFK